MQFVLLIVTLFGLSVTALALNPGIFDDDGHVKNTFAGTSPVIGRRLYAGGTPTTNAARMARNLPPLPPVRRRLGQLKPRASPVPCNTVIPSTQGIIEVLLSDGTSKGYISKSFDSQNSYTYGDLASAQTFSLPPTNYFNTPIDITAVNGPSPSQPLLGSVGGSGGFFFGSGQGGYTYLAGVTHTAAGSPPSSSAQTSIQSLGYNGPSESQIWTLNCDLTLSLTAQWTNMDGSQPPTTIFYDPVVNYLGLTGDLATYNADYGDGATAMVFYFIPA